MNREDLNTQRGLLHKVQRDSDRDSVNGGWQSRHGDSFFFRGDCFDLFPELSDESIDCVWTDPPYLLSNDGSTCSGGKRVSVNKGTWDKSRGLTEDFAFHQRWLVECFRVLKPAGTIWVSGTFHAHAAIGWAMQLTGFRILNDIVWHKPAPPPNLGTRTFTHASELLWWATKAPKGSLDRYTFNYREMKSENGGKQMTNVWSIPSVPRLEKLYGKHPTQKPLALVERCLRASTNEGNVVLDPFAGSGTVPVVASVLNRRFIASELESDHVETAIRRLEALATPLAVSA